MSEFPLCKCFGAYVCSTCRGPIAAPPPGVEQMIEAMGGLTVIKQADDFYIAGEPDTGKMLNAKHGDTPREAVAALYRAWRERE